MGPEGMELFCSDLKVDPEDVRSISGARHFVGISCTLYNLYHCSSGIDS